MDREQIAQLCHEANRAHCQLIGDNSQKPWAEAEDWQRESAINGVDHALDNPDAKASDSHVNWMREKLESGWRLGHIKDENEKTHPCLVAFEDLPVEQQAKDYIFLAIARGAAAMEPETATT